MSLKGKKATATKASKERSPVLTTGRTPVRSPLDDGARSQMFNLSSDLSNSRPLPVRRRSGGTEPHVSLDLDPPPKKRKQKELSNKEDSSPASLHATSDPNLGSRLEDEVETRAQQAQNRARSEQTPLKERSDRSAIAIEGQDSSSAIAKGNEGLPQGEKSNQSLPPKPLSSRKPVTDWADEISDVSEEEVNNGKEEATPEAIVSSQNRADYASIRAEINPASFSMPRNDAIVQVSSPLANNAEVCHISVARLFLSQSKENSPSASPLRERDDKSPVEHIDPIIYLSSRKIYWMPLTYPKKQRRKQ